MNNFGNRISLESLRLRYNWPHYGQHTP